MATHHTSANESGTSKHTLTLTHLAPEVCLRKHFSNDTHHSRNMKVIWIVGDVPIAAQMELVVANTELCKHTTSVECNTTLQ